MSSPDRGLTHAQSQPDTSLSSAASSPGLSPEFPFFISDGVDRGPFAPVPNASSSSLSRLSPPILLSVYVLIAFGSFLQGSRLHRSLAHSSSTLATNSPDGPTISSVQPFTAPCRRRKRLRASRSPCFGAATSTSSSSVCRAASRRVRRGDMRRSRRVSMSGGDWRRRMALPPPTPRHRKVWPRWKRDRMERTFRLLQLSRNSLRKQTFSRYAVSTLRFALFPSASLVISKGKHVPEALVPESLLSSMHHHGRKSTQSGKCHA